MAKKSINFDYKVLKHLNPTLVETPFAFCQVQKMPDTIAQVAIGWFREEEGITLVSPTASADEQALSYEGSYTKITLNVYSDLAIVGLTAAVSTALTQANIPCNMIAGYHHDHLFVPYEKRHEALVVLENLSAQY